ncbi:MAG TPA: hypothetical protein VKF32_03415 [Thermoanaerobaculia bacterium]|nr:hypothetical protein [Thermoanaerobaculia bacterium]
MLTSRAPSSWSLPSTLLALLLSALPARGAENVRVTAGTIDDDRRTSAKFGGGLELELKLTGDGLEGARAARVVVKKAVDESGRDLLPEKAREPEFSKVGDHGSGMKISLKNPARGASAIAEIAGEVQLFAPGRDPAATVVIDKLSSRIDKPLSSTALKTAKIDARVVSPKAYREKSKSSQAEFEKEMAKHKDEVQKETGDEKQAEAMMALAKGLMSMMGEVGENDLVLSINDPEKRIFDIEVANREGKTIESNGSMSSGDVRILNFKEKLPADAKLRIFLKTGKSVASTPFSLKDVPLP